MGFSDHLCENSGLPNWDYFFCLFVFTLFQPLSPEQWVKLASEIREGLH